MDSIICHTYNDLVECLGVRWKQEQFLGMNNMCRKSDVLLNIHMGYKDTYMACLFIMYLSCLAS